MRCVLCVASFDISKNGKNLRRRDLSDGATAQDRENESLQLALFALERARFDALLQHLQPFAGDNLEGMATRGLV
jgi:hypothetical protein